MQLIGKVMIVNNRGQRTDPVAHMQHREKEKPI